MAKAKVNIYINSVRVGKCTKYDHDRTDDVTEIETFDGTELSSDDSPKYTLNLSRVDSMTTFENTLEKAMMDNDDGVPIVIQDGNIIVKATGCYRTSKKVNRDTKNKRTHDMSFRCENVEEEYR